MPTNNNVSFRIQSLKEIENQLNLQDFPAEGLPVCNSRLGYEIDHTDEQVTIRIKVLSLYEGKVVVSYVVEGVFGFDDIHKYFDFAEDQFMDKAGILPTLLGVVIDALRGMQALRMADTPFNDAILQYVNPSDLLVQTQQ